MKYIFCAFAISVLLTSCDEPVRLDIDEQDSRVVIEAQVTNRPHYQYVKISSSVGFYETGKSPRVTNADVMVTDDLGNEFPFVHNPNAVADSLGYYLPENQFVAEVGRTYALRVAIGDNVYEASDRLNPVTTIDSLSYRIDEEEQEDPEDFGKFYEVLIYAKEPQQTTDYYLFKFFRNDSLKVASDTEIYFADDETLGENIDGVSSPIYFAPGDKARCEIYSISRTAFVFYSDLQRLLNNDGGLFSQPPANTRTNISNGALGFFQVSSIHIKEIEIKE